MTITAEQAQKAQFENISMFDYVEIEFSWQYAHEVVHTITNFPPGSQENEIVINIYEYVLRSHSTFDPSPNLEEMKSGFSNMIGDFRADGYDIDTEEAVRHFNRALKLADTITRNVGISYGDFYDNNADKKLKRIPFADLAIEHVIEDPEERRQVMMARRDWMGDEMHRQFCAELEASMARSRSEGRIP